MTKEIETITVVGTGGNGGTVAVFLAKAGEKVEMQVFYLPLYVYACASHPNRPWE